MLVDSNSLMIEAAIGAAGEWSERAGEPLTDSRPCVRGRKCLSHARICTRSLPLHQLDQPAHRFDEELGIQRVQVALARQAGVGNSPSFADRSEHAAVGHVHVLEEDLVEVGVAVDLSQWSHGDAGRLHVDEEHRQTLVPQ